MEFLQQIWHWVLDFGAELRMIPSLVAEVSQRVWNFVPGKDSAEKLTVLFTVLGGLTALQVAHWLWQKWHKTDIDSEVGQIRTDLKELKALLVQRAQAQDAAQPGGGTPEAREAEAGIEKDIGAAIATLAEAGKTAALEALGRGDTQAADAVLAAKIAEIESARTGAAKEEAALYRQRGALAYLNAPLTALPLYAKAAELDPDDPEGWTELGNLQVRTGAFDAAIWSFETVLRLANGLEDRGWEAIASGNLGVIYKTRGELDAAKASYRRALEIAEALDNKKMQTRINGNLGSISLMQGDLDAAEAIYRKALEIDEARWAIRKVWPATTAISASSMRVGAIWTRPRLFTARRWRSMRRWATRKVWPSDTAISASSLGREAIWKQPRRFTARRWRSTRRWATRKVWPSDTAISAKSPTRGAT